MSFKHPEFLYLLFVILIPVIIHLFNFRRYKKLWFSNIEFLKNITLQTRKQNKLKHLLVLFTRILAITFIVFAFAKPEFGKNEKPVKQGQTVTSIYLDNSFSMMAEGEEGRLFDESVEVAREIAGQAPHDRQFILLNNQNINANRLLNKEGIQSELDAQTISPASINLSSVLNSAKRTAIEKDISGMEFYLLSDFQQNSFDFASFPTDSTTDFYFVPFPPVQKRNIFIDSCWISDPVLLPGRQVLLSIRVRNASMVGFEKIPLKLNLNGQQKAVAAIDIPAMGFEDVSITITPDKPGWQSGLIEIEDFPVTFDDSYYFTFYVSQRIGILEIFDENTSHALEQFYNSDSIFEFNSTHFRQINYSLLNDYSLIVLNALPVISSGLANQLAGYMEKGGTVLFVPNPDADLTDENNFLKTLKAGRIIAQDTGSTRVVGIKTNHELFRDVVTRVPENADLPVVSGYFKYGYSISSGLVSLVSLLDGSDFLLTKKIGDGRLFLLGVPLKKEFSNFTSHALFVPIMYGIATQQDVIKRMAYTIGSDRNPETDFTTPVLSESPFILKSSVSDYSFIPGQKVVSGKLVLDVHDGIATSGFYNLMLSDSVYQVFGYNFNRDESKMEFYGTDELNDLLAETGLKNYAVLENTQKAYAEVIGSIQKESEIWKLFIIFALLLLLAELLILRFWK